MARRKIVFVIVEGPSDEEALGVIFNRIFDNNAVFVHIMHCDITTEKGINASNIISKIGNEIRQYAVANHYNKNDFKEILHLVDMDGAYIPEECIEEDRSVEAIVYSTTGIKTPHRENIVTRNKQKSANLDKLRACKSIWSVPYRVFYMSCNLDHVLYNKLNSTDIEKEEDSYRFAKKYREDISGFLGFISKSDFSVMTGYNESWDYIRQERHSLERGTNLGLCFEPKQ